MKLPNGYGSVQKLSGKRRKPYAAVKTVGWEMRDNGKAKQIYKYIGYYETKKEALQALAEYNENPIRMGKNITFADLYEKWSDIEYRTCSDSYKRVYKASYKALEPIYNIQVDKLTLDQFQAVVDASGKNEPTLKKVRSLICKMYDYALMAEIITPAKREMVNHVDIRSAENPNNIERIPFTDDEIKQLWKIGSDVHGVLIMIYTGLRVSEFAELKKSDVHIDERWLYVRKAKTKAGVRTVPICEKIVPIFEQYMNTESDYMFNCVPAINGKVSHFKFNGLMEKIGMKHRPHDCRHTCVSMMIRSGINLTLIKKMVGHASGNVTEDIYSHADLKDMIEAINKI